MVRLTMEHSPIPTLGRRHLGEQGHRDTFPAHRQRHCRRGVGFGGKTAAAFPWLTEAPQLCYWGDIDADGYEILNGWREDGFHVTSMLMDCSTYETYARFGTDTDQNGHPLKPATRKPLPRL